MSFDPIEVAMAARMAAKMNGGGSDKKYEWKPIIDMGNVEIPFEVNDGEGVNESTSIQGDFDISFLNTASADTKAKIVLDGVEYICHAFMYPDYISFGDTFGDWTTEFPFCVDFLRNEDGSWDMNIYVNNDKPTHTFAFYLQVEATQSGSSGGGGLPVVELETQIVDDPSGSYETTLSEADSAKLTALEATDTPIVVKFNCYGFIEIACFGKLTTEFGDGYFSVIVGSEGDVQWMLLAKTPTGWMAQTKHIA